MIPFYNIITAFLGVCTASVIIVLIRKDKLSVNYSLWWGILAAGLIIFGLAPKLSDYIGEMLGVHYPPILIVIISICLLFIKLLFMDIHRSTHEQQIRILTERLALYEKENSKKCAQKSHSSRINRK